MDKFQLRQSAISSPSSPTVKLIQALRLPARHAKVIKFSMELSVDNSDRTLMFELTRRTWTPAGTVSCETTKE